MSERLPSDEQVLAIARRFETGPCGGPVQPLGEGHIHDTFRVGAPGAPRFVLQRVNEYVFPDAEALVANLERVTLHIRERLRRRGVDDLDRRCLRIVPAADGSGAVRDAEGRLWRCMRYVEDTRSVDRVTDHATAFATAYAFGEFLEQLSDLPPTAVRDTIAHFHDLPRRVEQLERAAAADAEGRAGAVAREIDALLATAREIAAATAAAGATALPRRVVHNDCKVNNLLLDRGTGEPVCVVDLDTVMAGNVLADFGELVRTSVPTAAEDEPRLERIEVDAETYRGVVEGFVAAAGPLLEHAETAALPLAGPTLALENAVRFLADHLEGDRYFRIRRPGHNLDRARAQLRAAELLMDAGDAARAFVAAARAGPGVSRSSASPGRR